MAGKNPYLCPKRQEQQATRRWITLIRSTVHDFRKCNCETQTSDAQTLGNFLNKALAYSDLYIRPQPACNHDINDHRKKQELQQPAEKEMHGWKLWLSGAFAQLGQRELKLPHFVIHPL
ncbi:hypothetical protein RB195_017191 [Necator americanus]|uniref:Uncharacterized protein n=1 Tax=Necator americanus TaxID=51031 RepID=A0ABR1C439_NECAM